MDAKLRTAVRERAGNRCEYCCVPQSADLLPFQVDHIIAEVHHGPTEIENLAWSCFDCNVFKGPNLAGIDSSTGQVVRLFHPRSDRWGEHFEWDGPHVSARTAIGRATVDVLRLNLLSRVEHRRLLMLLNDLPVIES